MTFYAVYRDDDLELVSVGSVLADPLPAGLTAKPFDTMPVGMWDKTTLDFVPAAQGAKTYTPLEFLRRFTMQERAAIRSSSDAIVQDFMYLLDRASEVVTDDPDTINGLSYLVSLGLMTDARATEVLS